MSPIKENANTVTPGRICLSCAQYQIGTCPYGNHLRGGKVTTFQGDIRGKCTVFMPIEMEDYAENSQMKKESSRGDILLKEAKLNVDLYRKIMAMSPQDRTHLFKYWNYIYGPKYANDLVDDVNKSVQRDGPKIVRKKKQKKKH